MGGYMITMHNLGKNGLFGNQIFQFAFLFGLHKAKGYDYSIPENTDLMKCFDVNCKIQNINLNYTKNENNFYFDINYPASYSDNTNYTGYYQSEKYFKHCKQDLLSVLKFKEQWKIPLTLDTSNLVSIHVRRGDYVNNPHYELVSMDYINTAKKQFTGKKFIVFSDDIQWCKNNNVGDFYSEGNNRYIDLYQMTLCSGSIIANSTFSWWGAYLTPKEKVVAPSKWFGPAYNPTKYNPKDIYCKEWIVI
jgi:hypothetical protein